MLGKRIRLLRESCVPPLTRDELASRLNLKYQTISKYETDDREPDYETLKAIAGFFNVSVDYLLGKTNIRQPYTEDTPEEIADLIDFIKKSSKSMSPDETKQLLKMTRAFVQSTKEGE